MKEEDKYSLHGLVNILIRTNVSVAILEQIDFQIAYFKVDDLAAADIEIDTYDQAPIDSLSGVNSFHDFKGVQKEWLINDQARFVVNKKGSKYFIYTDVPFLINIFIQFILIEKGYSMVHAAGIVSAAGAGLLLPGAGGVGKTAILGDLVKNKGYKLLGDDIIILGPDSTCLSFPRSFVLKSYHRSVYPEAFQKLGLLEERKRIIPAIMEFIRKNAPFTDLIKKFLKKTNTYREVYDAWPFPPAQANVPISELFGKNAITDKTAIKRSIFLERSDIQKITLKEMDTLSLRNRMFSIINHEWISEAKLIYTLGALEIIDLPEYFKKMEDIILNFSEKSKKELLLIPRSMPPAELSKEFEILCLKNQ